MATMKKARVMHRKALKPEDADILHHTPHKISASSGFNAFLCSTLAFFIVAMASHLQLCSIEGFGKRPYSFLQCDTCAVTRVKKAYSVGFVKSAAACCTCFSLVVEYDDQAEARATSSSRLDNSH